MTLILNLPDDIANDLAAQGKNLERFASNQSASNDTAPVTSPRSKLEEC